MSECPQGTAAVSAAQGNALRYLTGGETPIWYDRPHLNTLTSLERRGLVSWATDGHSCYWVRPVNGYLDHWYPVVTDFGEAVARGLFPWRRAASGEPIRERDVQLRHGPMLKALRRFETAFARMADAVRRHFPRPVLVVDDPALERPATFEGWLSQAKAVVLHEFWMAADRPARSPGARWVWPKRDLS